MKNNCQLYRFNDEIIEIEENSVKFYTENFDSQNLEKSFVYWLNFHDLSKRSDVEEFCEKQDIDKLTIEDIYNSRKRPKLEEYDNYLFFSILSALPTTHGSVSLVQEQISFILGPNFLISLQEKSSDHFTEVRERLTNKKAKIRERGADFLLFRMLDAIVDNYFEVLDYFSEIIRSLESKIIQSRSTQTLKSIESEKRKLIELRKIVVPLKDIAIQLENVEHPYLVEKNHHYFKDLKGNCLAIIDEIDSNKSILEGMANLYYAVQGQKMNEIMKLLTIVSTIFIPLTFIVGVYGMNFKYMPELSMKNGYLSVWIAMVIIAVLLIFFFLKKGWLKNK